MRDKSIVSLDKHAEILTASAADTRKPQWADAVKEFVNALTELRDFLPLLAALVYGIARLNVDAFYKRFGLTPDGLTYQSTLARLVALRSAVDVPADRLNLMYLGLITSLF